MRIIIFILLAFGLICAGAVQAQVGSSISSDGTTPNDNAMLDVQSPVTGNGKGLLIPRVSQNQRTNANASLDGGLLGGDGNLRGGAAQGLIVYQTDGDQGLYFNTSQAAAPTWAYLGDVTGLLASNIWAAAGSTTNYLPRTGGTMSGVLNMGAQIVTNVAHIDFNGDTVSVGRGANGASSGAAVGNSANGSSYGAALGWDAIGTNYGAAVGRLANGSSDGAALGYFANGSVLGAAMGSSANGYNSGAAMGYLANGTNSGAALGREANGNNSGAALGYSAVGSDNGAAVGYLANGYYGGVAMGYTATATNYGVAVGLEANGSGSGAALGREANGTLYGAAVGWAACGYDQGAALGYLANGSNYGVAVGRSAIGTNYGVAVGRVANGSVQGVAIGYNANGERTNVAIGVRANAQGGTERIAIGHNVTNTLDDTVRIRGKLYLDGVSGGVYTNVGGFGSSDWGLKAFTIDHPLDPANKVLRHFCLEGPQVWNVYAGNAQLVNGQAIVQLPDYYSALNLAGSEICSLTPWGRANVWVARGVDSNTFSIAGDADVKVSWTVKVLRNDPGCLEDLQRRPVEQLKSEIR